MLPLPYYYAEPQGGQVVAGQTVAKTIGDIALSQYKKTGDDKWAEGGVYKTILQAAGAGLVTQLGNSEVLDVALGAAASQLPARLKILLKGCLVR